MHASNMKGMDIDSPGACYLNLDGAEEGWKRGGGGGGWQSSKLLLGTMYSQFTLLPRCM